MKVDKTRNALKIGNVSTIINNQLQRTKFLFCIKPDGSSYYWFNGMELSKEELDLLYPIEPHLIRKKGLNPDGTKAYYE